MTSNNHALHQVRVSQLPLGTHQKGTVSYQPDLPIDPDGNAERLSGLDHVRYNIVASQDCRKFIIRLAHALMEFGAPMHKIDEQLAATCDFLSIKAHFVLFNTVIIAVFDDPDDAAPSRKHIIQKPHGLDLARLQKTHKIYSDVIHDEITASEGTERLNEILKEQSGYGTLAKIVIAFVAGFAICPFGFSGSLTDSLIAGSCSAGLMTLQLWRQRDALFVNIFEMLVVVIISFVSRLLNSVGGHRFCYSAISSSGVVLILPGFTVLQGSLELASKNFITGATKIVYAIIYSLILGFSLTLGSDIGFEMLSTYRKERSIMSDDFTTSIRLFGAYTANNATRVMPTMNGTFAFTQLILPNQPIQKYHYVMEGCYRDNRWSFLFQSVPWWSLFLLWPAFVFSLSALNGQHHRDWKRMLVMVILGCCSLGSNKLFNHWFYDRGDVVSAIGATVVGVLGTVRGHYSEGDALPSMIPGILVLLPAGLSVVGGLSANFASPASSVMSWLISGMKMVQVTIGITVGLYACSLSCQLYRLALHRFLRKPMKKTQVGCAF